MIMDFNWTTVGVALLNLLLGGGLVAAWIKTRPAILKIESDREANLLHERADEMASMRTELASIRAEMARRDEEHAAALEARTKVHEAERRADIHRINNLSQCLDALLLLLKKGVSVEEAVEAIEKMRSEQLTRENEERALLRAAVIAGGHPITTTTTTTSTEMP